MLVTDDDGTQLYTYDLGFEDIMSTKAIAAFKASGLKERPRWRSPTEARAAYDRVARGRGLIPGAPTSRPGREPKLCGAFEMRRVERACS